MNKPTPLLRSILLFVLLLTCSLNYLSAQTYIGSSSTPADNGAQAGPTVTVNPASVGTMQTGDLVIMYAQYEGTTQTLSIGNNGGQTWFSETQANGTNQRTRVFWCRFNGSWATNPSVTVTTGTSSLSVIMYVFRPLNSTNKWFANVGPVSATTTATAVTVNGITTTAPNSVTMAFWGSPAANTWNSLSAGWTKPGSTQYRNTTSGQSHTAAYKIMSSAGATGNVSQTQSSSQATTTMIMSWVELPDNDNCSSAITLTPTGICQPTAGNLFQSTQSSPAGSVCGNRYDVWYKFTLPSNAEATFATISVALTSSPSTLTTTNTYVELFNANACPVTSPIGACNNISSARSYLNLTPGATYYFRVNTSATPTTNSAQWGFNVCVTTFQPTAVGSGRMNEVFSQTVLSPAGILDYPWEVTYGPDNKLWITESKGYKVYRMDPSTGTKTTVLDISQGSTFFSAPDNSFNCQFANGSGAQGGLAGLALHPNFMNGLPSEKNFVYISYIYSSDGGTSPTGVFFTNRLVRFTYNTLTGKLEQPVSICDTLPGSSDHNSQRIVIAPVVKGGTNYLFYAQGDMGAGQFGNRTRPQKAQNIDSYEGKILRFNLDTVGNPGPHKWIPIDNPYSSSSAVYSMGIRNNQGFAYDTATNVLYGSSHGPFSDDEINIIEAGKNYGHPLVIGYAADGNYNGITAGSAPNMSGGSTSSCPVITNEVTAASTIGVSYKDPLFSAYTVPDPSTGYANMSALWNATTGGNNIWPSEGWSGLDLYSHTLIPGWKRSLVASGLKWGRLIKLKLGATGTTTLPSNLSYGNSGDTVTYFQSTNRYRDLAFAPNGKDIFVIMDNSSATSGPGVGNPMVPACAGCVIKYSFLGYADNGGKSSIPTSIDVAAGTDNTCQNGTTVTIDATNNNLWVPITGQDGNILAEIKANGNNLGTVTSSFYTNTGTVRETSAKKLYANRNITITPQTQPSSAVSIRLYLTAAEYNALRTATNSQGSPSGISGINDLIILKNTDVCSPSFSSASLTITPQYAEAFGSNYVLQANINSFSSFYFAGLNATTLPAQLLTFTGSLQNNDALLKWQTTSETNTSAFIVERSIDGNNYSAIGNVAAKGSSSVTAAYSFTDGNVVSQASTIVYYRLKTVDKNGQYSYSRVISIILSKNINVFLFPNPVKQILNVRLNSSANPIHIQITDLTGRVVYSEKHLGSQNSISIDVKQWKPQVYILKVINSKNEILTTSKFEKM